MFQRSNGVNTTNENAEFTRDVYAKRRNVTKNEAAKNFKCGASDDNENPNTSMMTNNGTDDDTM
jgi:hypothetical protein